MKFLAAAVRSLLMTVLLILAPARALKADQIKIFVSIPPQVEFLKAIGGKRVLAEVLLGQGQGPHSFDPSPRTIARLSEARLFFSIGVPYERLVISKLSEISQSLEIVDTRQGIMLRQIEGKANRGHGGDDPHIWLDPELVKTQARTIHDALVRVDSEGKQTYRRNLDNFTARLDSLDNRLTRILEPLKGREIYVYHPAFGYFFEAYGMRQRAVQRGGHDPSARELASLVESMRSEGVRVIIVQPEFPSPVAEALQRSLGCRVLRLDPLAADYIDNMGRMARLVAEALNEENGD
jgi:zinc transport system substrate-binding protein